MQLNRFNQISEEHCGPAVLQMLLDAIDINVSQEEITAACGAEYTIHELGVTIDQLGLATQRLVPTAQFWIKNEADLSDIRFLLQKSFPVGVEWQGLFYQSEEEEKEALENDDDEEADFGHYSVVTHMDDEMEELVIVDPYKDFKYQNRIIDYDMFLRRWYDVNEVTDHRTGYSENVKDLRTLFFVTPKGTFLPKDMGFRAFV